MRIASDNKIYKELDELKPYLAFNGKEWDVKPDAPEEIKKKYYSLRAEYRKMRYES